MFSRVFKFPRASPTTFFRSSNFLLFRAYSGGDTKLSLSEVTNRVLTVVKAFEKVDQKAVTDKARFQEDLGLDSLDSVEVVMALEDEFVIEIPDAEAEKILSCEDAINYISTHPHAK
eukprot:TRINITY_DN571_c0_g1_i2.p1 TRINITY_DN571_c0_g1~~TRINITY_DN571_c0_g1_i2.p1  ORF type:complete len:117 (-),score=12.88 TRINITY_DN571_c0_g1_i2:99-449(-)